MAQEISSKSGSAAPSAEDEARFVMSFIDDAKKPMTEMQDVLQETLGNLLVKPYSDTNWYQRTDKPYYTTRDRQVLSGAILKTPESNQIAMSLMAKAMPTLFGKQGFIRCRPVGSEDLIRSDTTSRVLQYDFRIPGHYRTVYEWILDGIWSGTGMIKGYWRYEEDERLAFSTRYMDGTSLRTEQMETYASFDDPCLQGLDLMKFYPDPGHTRIAEMIGAADESTITGREAMMLAEQGKYDKNAVKRAIGNARKLADMKDSSSSTWDYRKGFDQSVNAKIPDDFLPLKRFEYYGDTPFPPDTGMKRRRVLTVLNGELVRRRSWFLPTPRLPYFDCTINPMQGRFYGLSPLEIMRYHQDFTDAMLMNIADGTMRSIHAQPMVDRNAMVEIQKLRRPGPDVPVLTNSVDAVKFLEYRPPIMEAWRIMTELIGQMRSGAGAVSAIQGLGLGIDRASATEAQGTFAAAMDRPELMVELIERDSLPPLGRFLLSLNQAYLDEEGLAKRVGQVPGVVELGDIDGDFDVEFVGSRLVHSQQEELGMMERIEAQIKTSPFAAIFPWMDFYKRWLKVAELPELEALVGNAESTRMNIALQQMSGNNQAAGNGNGTAPAALPAGMIPAQAAGRAGA